MIYNFTLDNGIRCIIKKLDGVFSVNMGILVGVGSVNELDSENGISHFIEHVNFKGTDTRTSFDLSHDAEALGSQINAFTTKEMTVFYIKSTKEHASQSFDILADAFLNSTYNEAELQKEKGVIVEEINMYLDTPDELCADTLSVAFFGKGGYGSSILGSVENVNSFSKKDITDYKNKFYTTDNIVVSFAGNIEPNRAKELVEKYFGSLKSSKKSLSHSVNSRNLCNSLVVSRDIEQVQIALAFDAVSINDEKADSYNILSNALGGGMSSRLFQEVRERKGLCYSIYSYLNLYRICGSFCVFAGVNSSHYKDAFESITNELYKLKKNGLTNEEFLCAKEQIKSNFVYMQDNSASQMILYGKKLLFDNVVFDVDKKMRKINEIELDEVNSVLLNAFDCEKISCAAVGRDVCALK
ncbi:MAG: M16 family metallopeptidase [Christensenellaceae bacterium]